MVSQDVHIPLHSTCAYVILFGKENFADTIKLSIETSPWIIQVGPVSSQGLYNRKAGLSKWEGEISRWHAIGYKGGERAHEPGNAGGF